MALTIDSQQTAITTATTTTILSAPGAGTTEKHAKAGWITMRNKGGADNTLTIIMDNGTAFEKDEVTLGAGEGYVVPYDVVLRGTGDTLQLITSSTSAIDVDVAFTQKD